MENEPSNKKIFSFIKDNFIIIAFIAQLIISWTIVGQKLEDHTERLVKLETYRENESVTLADIQTRLASIETSLVFIKERLK